ncbi:phosphatase 2C-like domain-containing protein [Schizophyllum amplum]|uniref:Phosphatase 2C-like domain-containing protein n=1 Tax=Schizophyllum amplum TaxID=97359 RepID=A0A550C9T5_9AGAR|nr:phosphatase 2C-like domain-containing protein [Auriculariopsis ampla]
MAGIRKETHMGMGHKYGPWAYTSLKEPKLSAELARMAGANLVGDTYSLSFQPFASSDSENEDRFTIMDLKINGRLWRLRGIFDGHSGPLVSTYIASHLPSRLHRALAALPKLDNKSITQTIRTIITQLDKSIISFVQELFPSQSYIARLSDDEIRRIIKEDAQHGSGSNRLMRGIQGSTLLLSLVDPEGKNLWVASLGDCQAVLLSKLPNGTWESSLLSSYHNASNPVEVTRLRSEHPGEERDIVSNNRVLGMLAVTRCIGDLPYKLPAIYTSRIFPRIHSDHPHSTTALQQHILPLLKTPPYLSSDADIRHVDLLARGATSHYLILYSDGLLDLYNNETPANVAARAVQVVTQALHFKSDLALAVLMDGLGHTSSRPESHPKIDLEKVSRMMTVEMMEKYMDDTTVLVEKIR